MALIFPATAWTYLTKGIILQNKITNMFFTVTDKIIHWVVWVTLQVLAIFSYPIFETNSIMFWWLTMV